MKKTIVYLLLFTLTFQCLGSLGVLAWFQVNRDYITQVLCENRDKPQMHCNGQCALMKKLKKLEETEKGSQSADTHKTEVVMIVSETIRLPEPLLVILSDNPLAYGCGYKYLYMNKLFLPPKIA
ncbi:hypothetical protein [Sphingobacterium thalpophilum]|uniref:hypothetical protein n=1 Tax=Sphingobacterium thalpophilum TaxID=259 RepID=UPI0024A6D7B3|nr:hypothetical protein [Sphingobacterium thalpophilum]